MVITGRDETRLMETFRLMEGNNNVHILADLTKEDDILRLVSLLPSLDGLVLCAGIGITKTFQFSTRDQYDKVFSINFFAPIELLRILAKKKYLKKYSSVVIVSSIGGVMNFNPGNGIYGASKAALNSVMKYCALELSHKNIRVNSVNPGMVNTKLIKASTISDEQLQSNMQKYPLKRYGEPEEVAWGIIYLLSDAASWVTGHSLVIDGGLTI